MRTVSLRWKILLILIIVTACYSGLNYGIQRLVIFPGFVELEHRQAKKDLDRCFEALEREIHHLDTFNHDWAAWDDTYEFVFDKNTTYIRSNFVEETFVNNELNLIYVCNNEGKVVWGDIREIKAWSKIELAGFPAPSLTRTHPLMGHDSAESVLAGVFMTEKGPMLVSSRPILKSVKTGPIRGALIMGRFLSENAVERLARQTRVDFRIWSAGMDPMPKREEGLLKDLKKGDSHLIDDDKKNITHIYATYPDVQGKPALLVQADIPREISVQGGIVLRFALLSTIAAVMVVLLILFVLLKRTVVTPVEELTAHVVSVGRNYDLSARLSPRRIDEIGTLEREFDGMVEQLKEARKRLLEKSYQAGMLEMASNILHNIRNILNPMVVDIDHMRQELKRAPIDKISIALNEVAHGAPSSERRQQLTRFIVLTNEKLSTLFNELGSKLGRLLSQAARMEEILPDRAKLSRWKQGPEPVDLNELANSALALIPEDVLGKISVEMDPGISKLGLITTNRISVLHIMANLLINAAESVKRAGVVSGKIRISAGFEDWDGVNMAHVKLQDNGEGIDPLDLDSVFERDFAQQKGFESNQLHWCANAVNALGGRLFAESKGPGCGTCFHLLLPTNAETTK